MRNQMNPTTTPMTITGESSSLNHQTTLVFNAALRPNLTPTMLEHWLLTRMSKDVLRLAGIEIPVTS